MAISPESQAQGKGRGGQPVRAAQQPGGGAGEIGVGNGVGGGQIERAAGILVFQQEADGGDFIGQVDPGQALAASARAARRRTGARAAA